MVWVIAWFWAVGFLMAVGRMSFDDEVPRWQRLAIWGAWPVSFPTLIAMQIEDGKIN